MFKLRIQLRKLLKGIMSGPILSTILLFVACDFHDQKIKFHIQVWNKESNRGRDQHHWPSYCKPHVQQDRLQRPRSSWGSIIKLQGRDRWSNWIVLWLPVLPVSNSPFKWPPNYTRWCWSSNPWSNVPMSDGKQRGWLFRKWSREQEFCAQV